MCAQIHRHPGIGLLFVAFMTPLLAGCAAPLQPTACDAATTTNARAATAYAVVPSSVRAMSSVGRQGAMILDDALSPAVLIDDVATARHADGIAAISVRLFNCTPVDLQIDAATQFTDASGTEAEPPSIWKRLFLPPHTSRNYEEVSVGARAALLKVEVRGAP